jgi:hypothetical protein
MATEKLRFDDKNKDIARERLFVQFEQEKQPRDYAFVAEGRPGNPVSLHPKNFVPITRRGQCLELPAGTTGRLLAGDERAHDELRMLLRRRGIQGTVRVCRAYGGIGGGKAIHTVKANLKAGLVSTENKGFRVIVRDFEV